MLAQELEPTPSKLLDIQTVFNQLLKPESLPISSVHEYTSLASDPDNSINQTISQQYRFILDKTGGMPSVEEIIAKKNLFPLAPLPIHADQLTLQQDKCLHITKLQTPSEIDLYAVTTQMFRQGSGNTCWPFLITYVGEFNDLQTSFKGGRIVATNNFLQVHYGLFDVSLQDDNLIFEPPTTTVHAKKYSTVLNNAQSEYSEAIGMFLNLAYYGPIELVTRIKKNTIIKTVRLKNNIHGLEKYGAIEEFYELGAIDQANNYQCINTTETFYDNSPKDSQIVQGYHKEKNNRDKISRTLEGKFLYQSSAEGDVTPRFLSGKMTSVSPGQTITREGYYIPKPPKENAYQLHNIDNPNILCTIQIALDGGRYESTRQGTFKSDCLQFGFDNVVMLEGNLSKIICSYGKFNEQAKMDDENGVVCQYSEKTNTFLALHNISAKNPDHLQWLEIKIENKQLQSIRLNETTRTFKLSIQKLSCHATATVYTFTPPDKATTLWSITRDQFGNFECQIRNKRNLPEIDAEKTHLWNAIEKCAIFMKISVAFTPQVCATMQASDWARIAAEIEGSSTSQKKPKKARSAPLASTTSQQGKSKKNTQTPPKAVAGNRVLADAEERLDISDKASFIASQARNDEISETMTVASDKCGPYHHSSPIHGRLLSPHPEESSPLQEGMINMEYMPAPTPLTRWWCDVYEDQLPGMAPSIF